MMMGVSGKPESHDGKTMEPLENHGVQVMSIGCWSTTTRP
jgi:ATP-binding protein involved in chromosome partitioning